MGRAQGWGSASLHLHTTYVEQRKPRPAPKSTTSARSTGRTPCSLPRWEGVGPREAQDMRPREAQDVRAREAQDVHDPPPVPNSSCTTHPHPTHRQKIMKLAAVPPRMCRAAPSERMTRARPTLPPTKQKVNRRDRCLRVGCVWGACGCINWLSWYLSSHLLLTSLPPSPNKTSPPTSTTQAHEHKHTHAHMHTHTRTLTHAPTHAPWVVREAQQVQHVVHAVARGVVVQRVVPHHHQRHHQLRGLHVPQLLGQAVEHVAAHGVGVACSMGGWGCWDVSTCVRVRLVRVHLKPLGLNALHLVGCLWMCH